jgi:hypothetical protein
MYDGFISYSHAADDLLAQPRLELIPFPWSA